MFVLLELSFDTVLFIPFGCNGHKKGLLFLFIQLFGFISKHRLFVNDLTLHVEASQTLVESNKTPPFDEKNQQSSVSDVRNKNHTLQNFVACCFFHPRCLFLIIVDDRNNKGLNSSIFLSTTFKNQCRR